MFLGILGYLGMNAAAYVVTGASQADKEAKGKAPLNPLLKFVLGAIFLPAIILRAAFPITGTTSWRAKFRKQIRTKQNKFETRDCQPGVTKPMNISPTDKSKVEDLIKAGKYKEAFMALNPKLDAKQADMMADQFTKYVLRYRVKPEDITVDKLFDLVNNPGKEITFASSSSRKDKNPPLSGRGLFQRAEEETLLADQNRARVLQLRTVISDNKSLSRAVKKRLNEMLDQAQSLYINNHTIDMNAIYDKFRELAAIDGLTLDNPEFAVVQNLITQNETFRNKYNNGIYATMDVTAERTATKEPSTLDDKERLLLELNTKHGKKVANEYFEDYTRSVTRQDRDLATEAISDFEAEHTPVIESTLDAVTKLVLMNQYREATVGKGPDECRTIAAAMGISEDMIKDDVFNNQDIYDHVKGEDLRVIIELELMRKEGNTDEITRLEAERDRILSEKIADIEAKMAEDFEGKTECEDMLKALKDLDKDAEPVRLLLELTQLDIVIEKSKKITRDVDLAKEKAQAIEQLKEKYNAIAATLKEEEKPLEEAEMETFYAAINAATTLDGINAEVAKAEQYLDRLAMTLDQYKQQAMEELTKHAELDVLKEEIANKIRPILEAGIEEIRNAPTKDEVDIIVEKVKAAIDKEKVRTEEPELKDEERENAYNEVKSALDAVKGELTPDALAQTTGLLADARTALFNKDIKTLEALNAEKDKWIQKVNDLEKKKPIDLSALKNDAIIELSTLYARVRGTLDSADIAVADVRVDNYKQNIRDASTPEEITKILEEAKEYVLSMNQSLINYKEDLKQKLTEYAAVDSIADEGKKYEVITLLNEGLADIGSASNKSSAEAAFNQAKARIDQAKNRAKEDELTKEYRDAAYREIVAAYETIAGTLSQKGIDEGTALLATAEKAIYSPFVYTKLEIDTDKAKYINMINALDKKKEVEEELTQAERDAAVAEIERAVEAVKKELSDKGVLDAEALVAEARTTINDSSVKTREELGLIKDGYLLDVARLEKMKDIEIDQLARDAAYAAVSLAITDVRAELSAKGLEEAQKLLEQAEKAIYSPFIKTRPELEEVKNEYIGRVAGLDKNKEPEITQEERDMAYAEVNAAVSTVRDALTTQGHADADALLTEARNAINSQFILTKEQLEDVKNQYLARVANLDKMKDAELTQAERDAAFGEVRDAITAVRKELSEQGHADADAILINAKAALNSKFITSREQLEEVKNDYIGRVATLDKTKEPEITQAERDEAYKAVADAVEVVIAGLSTKGFKDAEQLLLDAKTALNSEFITSKEQLEDVKGQYLARVGNLEKKPDLSKEIAEAYAELDKKYGAMKDILTPEYGIEAAKVMMEAEKALNDETIETPEMITAIKNQYSGMLDNVERGNFKALRSNAFEEVKAASREHSNVRGGVYSADDPRPDSEALSSLLDQARNAINSEFIQTKEQLDDVKEQYIGRVNELFEKAALLGAERAKAKEELSKFVDSVKNELLSTEVEKLGIIQQSVINSINGAKSIEEVRQVLADGKNQIASLEKKPDLTQERKEALAAVEAKINGMKSELSTKGLGDAERLLADAKNAIESPFVETKDQLEAVKNDYLVRTDSLEKKPDLTQDKANAIQAVNKAILDASKELTKNAILKSQGIQSKAEARINACETLEAIAQARDEAIQEIAVLERKPSEQVKDGYKAKVENEYANYKAEIEKLEQSTGNNFGGKKSVMTKAKNAAYASIDAAESVKELEEAVKKAVDAFKTQLTKAKNEQFVTIVAELDGYSTTLVARNKDGITKVSMPGYKDFAISPALKDLTSDAAKQEIKRQAEMHRQRVHDNTRGVEGEIKP